MLRAEVQDLRVCESHRVRIFPGALDDRQVDRGVAHRPLAGREVSSQGMALKLRMGEDAAQIRVSFELDSEHVEGFTLGPIRALPDVHNAVDRGVFCRQGRLDAHAVLVR
jgi:hypothetical protein